MVDALGLEPRTADWESAVLYHDIFRPNECPLPANRAPGLSDS